MTTRTDRIHARLTPIEPATERLPYWTRSTNPIVRRHLGLYWRTLPPELRPVLQILLGWSLFLLLGSFTPSLLYFALIIMVVSIIVMPIAMLVYAHVLLTVAVQASDTMQEEKRNDTLNLLMATPMSLEQILLGKVAASLWRRMDDWILINYAVVLAAPPLFFSTYTAVWQAKAYPLALPIAVIAGTIVALLRILLEPVMIGMIGVFLGAVVPYRNTAISLAVAFTVAYAGFFWLLGQLPTISGGHLSDGSMAVPNFPLLIIINFILPIALPALLIWGLLKLTSYVITKD